MPDRPAPDLYNALFPYSVEVCAVTEYAKKGTKPGGWGGHATLFLSGAEIDSSAGYPRLRLLSTSPESADSDAGIGISVNKIFDSVTWVAIPGRDEFLRGGLPPDQELDEAAYEAAVQKAATAAGSRASRSRTSWSGRDRLRCLARSSSSGTRSGPTSP